MSDIGGVSVGIQPRISLIGSDRLMRLMKTHIEKERLGFVEAGAKPANSFLGDDVRRIAVGFANFSAVAHKITRIAMVRQGIVLRAEPVVEAVIARLGLRWLVEMPVEMPFAGVTRR